MTILADIYQLVHKPSKTQHHHLVPKKCGLLTTEEVYDLYMSIHLSQMSYLSISTT